MGHYFLLGFFVALGVLAAVASIFIAGSTIAGLLSLLGAGIRRKIPTGEK